MGWDRPIRISGDSFHGVLDPVVLTVVEFDQATGITVAVAKSWPFRLLT